MLQIQFPEPKFRTRHTGICAEVFDPLRKKWFKLTPEEWVRLNLVQYMVQVAGIPASLIAVEREIKMTDGKKRFDIVVFNRQGLPWLIVECKSMETDLDDKVISQVLAYMTQVPCRYMLISNGAYSYGWQINGLEFLTLEKFPVFPLQ